MILFALLLVSLVSSGPVEPMYTVEHTGLAFGWLPNELNPPAAGTLGTDSGTLASRPGSMGYDFRIHYWRHEEEMNSAARGTWLRQKLETTLPPDISESVVYGTMTWTEGSTAVSHLGKRSIGLCTSVNFNMLSGASVLYRGRAYGVFRDGYAYLIYGMAPRDAFPAVGEVMDFIIANAWMAGI